MCNATFYVPLPIIFLLKNRYELDTKTQKTDNISKKRYNANPFCVVDERG